MGNRALSHEGLYTWKDYRTWPDEERWELISGVAYNMSPAPSVRHQIIVGALGAAFLKHFREGPCVPLLAPVDVKLSDEDVVQPDLLVVCEKQKMKPSHIDGAPTLVVEILSPSTSVKDRSVKMELYARSGVSEVWIVTPYPSLIEVYSLTEQGYRLVKAYAKADTLSSVAFVELELSLVSIFDFPLEPDEEIRVVKESPGKYETAIQGVE